MPRTVHIKTFGCQMNVYDSDRMSSILSQQGFQTAQDIRQADVVLINTCSIRDKAEQKVLSLLGELKTLKKKNHLAVLGVTGCVGQRMGRTLLQKVPELDLVMGPDSIDQVGKLVDQVIHEGKRIVETKFDEGGRSYSQPTIVVRSKPSEYLTIMKGCDHFCTYCIVPFVRGREKSRAIGEIVGDVEKLVAQGTKEVIFLGQNINTYGKGTPDTLSRLIEEANKVQNLERIRYVTSHPRDLTPDLIAQFGQISKLCPQLHLPFQAGSDRVLKGMGRLYTQREYLKKVEALRLACPDIALSTDVIVGFPGETEEDFNETLHVLRAIRFSGVFLFKYSPRPGTRAYDFAEDVPETEKDRRLAVAQEVSFSMIKEENLGRIGRIERCLMESIDKKGRFYMGRTAHNKVVHVMNVGAASVGKMIEVEITEATGSNLKGYYTGAPRNAPPMVQERFLS